MRMAMSHRKEMLAYAAIVSSLEREKDVPQKSVLQKSVSQKATFWMRAAGRGEGDTGDHRGIQLLQVSEKAGKAMTKTLLTMMPSLIYYTHCVYVHLVILLVIMN